MWHRARADASAAGAFGPPVAAAAALLAASAANCAEASASLRLYACSLPSAARMPHSAPASSASIASRRLCSHADASAAAAASLAAASSNRYPPGNFFSAYSRRSVSSSLSVADAVEASMPPIHSNATSCVAVNERTRSASSDRTSARSNPGGAESAGLIARGVGELGTDSPPAPAAASPNSRCADASASSKTHHSRRYAGGLDHDDGATTTR
mmetsp:Transcript_6688/g.27710  ORF Transcript_6688/g.27710 Transcript_6688/m.27710 type:complete len:213 (+) Transcript_6688:442-1080(+)